MTSGMTMIDFPTNGIDILRNLIYSRAISTRADNGNETSSHQRKLSSHFPPSIVFDARPALAALVCLLWPRVDSPVVLFDQGQ